MYTGVYSNDACWSGQFHHWSINKLANSVYDKAITDEVRIQMLSALIKKMSEELGTYTTIADFQNYVKSANKALELLKQDMSIIVDTQIEFLEKKLLTVIEDLTLGKVLVQNPTFGQYAQSVEDVIRDVYDWTSYHAITVRDFDALNITISDFDSLELDVKEFDLHGKEILI